MSIKYEIRKLLWKVGIDIVRFAPRFHPLARRKQILNYYNIDTVLDIGANTGQFAQELRNDLGYKNNIISFEPLSSAFSLLKTNAKDDANWEVLNAALGDTNTKQEINIAGNSDSSSLLDMLASHTKAAPETRYIGRETIEVKKLDSVFDDLCQSAGSIYMKIDTQGYENKVLQGAEKSLQKIDTVQMEMSLVHLYEGSLLLDEMCMLMREKGYSLISIEPGFSDPDSGQLLQVDGIFHRFEAIPSN